MRKLFKVVLLFFLTWFAVHTLIVIADGLNDEMLPSECAVILGNKVNEDGTLSLRLEKRLEKGVELYRNSIVQKIVVSGGLGKEGFYEGTKMAEYLQQKGIPATAIIIDDEGNTTEETAINFRRLQPSAQSVIVVSQYYHITRTKLAFRQEGVKEVRGVHADFFEIKDIYSLVREFFGYYKYLLLY